MTEKRINDLERMGKSQGILAMICFVLAIVLAITGFITNNNDVSSFAIPCWLLGFVFSVQSYQNYNDRRVTILMETINKIVEVLTAEDKGAPESEAKKKVDKPEK